MKIIAAIMFLTIIFATAPASEAVTACVYARDNRLDLDKTALEMMESLGELTHLDAAFMTRIAKLPKTSSAAWLCVSQSTDTSPWRKLKKCHCR